MSAIEAQIPRDRNEQALIFSTNSKAVCPFAMQNPDYPYQGNMSAYVCLGNPGGDNRCVLETCGACPLFESMKNNVALHKQMSRWASVFPQEYLQSARV